MDVEAIKLDGTGWFTEDPTELTEQFGGVWKTADFSAGDVLIFSMRYIPLPFCVAFTLNWLLLIKHKNIVMKRACVA